MGRTCSDPSRKKKLEEYHPGVCLDVDEVLARNACAETFHGGSVAGWNRSREKTFREKIFQYTKENVALLKIFIKEPFCTEMIQEVKFPL